MEVRTGASSVASSFSSLQGMASGPVALEGFICESKGELKAIMAGQNNQPPSWVKLFARNRSPFDGYTTTLEDTEELLVQFMDATNTHYVTVKSKGTLRTTATGGGEESGNHRFYFDLAASGMTESIESDGVPFIVSGYKLLECHQGPSRQKVKETTREEEHGYGRQGNAVGAVGSKKKGCPSTISIRSIVRYPQYKVDDSSCTASRRKMAVRRVKTDLASASGPPVEQETRFYVFIRPEHKDHVSSVAAAVVAPIDKRVVNKVQQLVSEGIADVGEVQRHLRLFVKELFVGKDPPDTFNRKYYPSRRDIAQIVYRASKKLANGQCDLDALESFARSRPDEMHLVKPNETSGEELLMVYQTQWQKELLKRYGNHLTLLDGTYKTMRYAVPLYQLVVKTNVGYTTVAAFVVQREDVASLSRALKIIQEWNPAWNPSTFMIDADEKEDTAIRALFPGTNVYLCDFHVRQAWQRWVGAYKNGCHNDADAILDMLKKLAESPTEEVFLERLIALRNSRFMEIYPALRQYVETQWLQADRHKLWVWAFRDQMTVFAVNTNNGVEALHRVLKHTYLDNKTGVKSLMQVVKVMVDEYFPDMWRKKRQ